MADWHATQGKFDIPDVPDFIPRRLKPWIFIFFVLIIQFSGGVYLAAVTARLISAPSLHQLPRHEKP